MFIALLMGAIAGLRAMTPLAAVSWSARAGVLDLAGTPLAFMGYHWAPWIFTMLALAELVNDKLPETPSRTVPAQFITRVITGAWAGLAIGASSGMAVGASISGALGAVAGTLAGVAARRGMTRWAGGRDLPIALLEDCIAVGSAAFLACIVP